MPALNRPLTFTEMHTVALVIGEDPELDAKRFYRSEGGVTLVTAEMLAALD